MGFFSARFATVSLLAFTAPIKSERMLLNVFAERPAAAGLIAPSFPLMAGRSSSISAGAFPKSFATRVTAERKSRTRFGER